MRSFYLVRILLLGLALAMVLLIIQGANSKNMEGLFQALGLSPGTPDSPGIEPDARKLRPGDERFNLCKTRIAAVSWNSDRRIEEDHQSLKIRWMAYDPQPHEINSLEVESWFSHHCQIIVHPLDPHRLQSAEQKGTVTVRFVDHSEFKFIQFPDNQYQVDQRAFRSDDLSAALAELQKTAQFPVSTGL
jgi:hypothetical protein